MLTKGSHWRSAPAVPRIKAYLWDSSSSWRRWPRHGQTWISSAGAESGSNGWWVKEDAGVGGSSVFHLLNPNSHTTCWCFIRTMSVCICVGWSACCNCLGWILFNTISCSEEEATVRTRQTPKKMHNKNHMGKCVSLSVWKSTPFNIRPIIHSGINS